MVALTVLLVGETYGRRMVPRMSMYLWYQILNYIPHALRQGGYEPEEEQVESAKYSAILKEAKNLEGSQGW
jgi:hypothetical protein